MAFSSTSFLPSLQWIRRSPCSPATTLTQCRWARNSAAGFRGRRSESPWPLVPPCAATTDAPTTTKYLNFSDNALGWQDLEKALEQKKIAVGAVDENPETGPASCGARRRTFGKDEPIRVKLYRDPAAWCPYCQKVWMALELKQIPYEVEFIPLQRQGEKPQWYVDKYPSGTVPNMELDGEPVLESGPILEKLEEVFPEKRLLPEGAKLLKVLEGVTTWIPAVKGDDGALDEFCSQMDGVESLLLESGGPYFLGKDISLADVDACPFLERMNATLLYHTGVHLRSSNRWPALGRWFDAMETHPEYLGIKSDYFSLVKAVSVLFSGDVSEEGRPFADAIEGKGGAWKLPLAPMSETFESAGVENVEMDTYLAAKKLIHNREAVVGFALKGCDADDRDAAKSGVDCALRHVATALLNGTDHAAVKASSGEAIDASNVVPALEHIRDRVGVPRDFQLAQARQFRAHLNWMIDSVVDA